MSFHVSQLGHLIGQGDDPTGLPKTKSEPAPLRIIGAGGVRASSSQGTTILSLDNALLKKISAAEPPPVTDDPLLGMDFRCYWDEDTVKTKIGHVGHVYWDTSAWVHAQQAIAAETLTLPGSYPFGVYLKVPVTPVIVTVNDGTGPYDSYVSDPQTIDGSLYTFTVEYSTNWIKMDLTPPASYFECLTSAPSPSSSFYYLLLANVPSEASVSQVTFGNVTLPQSFWTNLRVITVA